MARNRMIKVEFWSDEKLAVSCSRDARLLYIGMWNYSDDYAVIKGHPVWLKSQIFPYDNLTILKFEELLEELKKLKRIIPFQASGEQYFYIVNFLEHQKINNPSQRVNPKPPQGLLDDIKLGLPEDSRRAKVGLPEDSRLKGKGKEKGKGKGKEKELFERFWEIYPNGKGKKPAWEKWLKLKITEELFETIMQAVKNQIKWRVSAIKGEFRPEWPNPKTWLHQKRWEDELANESEIERNYDDIPEHIQR